MSNANMRESGVARLEHATTTYEQLQTKYEREKRRSNYYKKLHHEKERRLGCIRLSLIQWQNSIASGTEQSSEPDKIVTKLNVIIGVAASPKLCYDPSVNIPEVGTASATSIAATSKDGEPEARHLNSPSVQEQIINAIPGRDKLALSDKASHNENTPTNTHVSPQRETELVKSSIHHSSQSTDASLDALDVEPVKEQSDEEPVFVSAREIRKARNGKDYRYGAVAGEDGRATHAYGKRSITVKEEHSSSPLQSSAVAFLQTQVSIDLDEPSGILETPRKRRRLEEMIYHDSSSPKSFPIPNSVPTLFDPKPGIEATTERNQTVSENEVDKDAHLQFSRMTRVLQPIDPNSRLHPANSGPKPHAAQRKYSRADQKMAEDGDNFSRCKAPSINPADGQEFYIKTEEVSSRRLNTLLSRSSPGKQLLPTSRSISRIEQASHSRSSPPEPETPRSVFGRAHNSHSLYRQHNASKQQTPSRDTNLYTASQTRPDEEPLRSRPLHSLTTSDFVINPAKNQGLDYAFTETVRAKPLRACLPYCVDPKCCGTTFRAIAEISGQPNTSSTSTTASTAEEDTRLLHEHLGLNAPSILHAMTARERREMLLRAKTAQMAQKYGKHRQQHERRASPPGFWRTEFPDTQQQEADKEEARRLEHEKVEARYWEAIKGDGKWVFRDELRHRKGKC